MIIRGGNKGGLDGVDVSGSNIWIHDLEVSNKDECVTIKNTAKNMKIEQIYCNWSGGNWQSPPRYYHVLNPWAGPKDSL